MGILTGEVWSTSTTVFGTGREALGRWWGLRCALIAQILGVAGFKGDGTVEDGSAPPQPALELDDGSVRAFLESVRCSDQATNSRSLPGPRLRLPVGREDLPAC